MAQSPVFEINRSVTKDIICPLRENFGQPLLTSRLSSRAVQIL